jgi:hypothetical protein
MGEGGEVFRELVEARVVAESRAATSEEVRTKEFDPFIIRGIG